MRSGSGRGAGGAVVAGWGHGGEVEEVDEQLGARHAVDRRMVDLAQQRHVAVVEALDHVDLPQRPGPVERPAHDLAGERGELGRLAGGGEDVAADVVVEIEVRVLDPDGVVEAERHLHHPAAEGRVAHEPVGDERPELIERVGLGHGRGVEHGGDGHVLVHRRRLEREERRVQA